MYQIVSLHLSDDDDTPYQTQQFFKYNFRFYEFVGLQTLSLHHIRIPIVLYQIIIYLRFLRHFTCLKIDQIHFDVDDVVVFSEEIWNVSTLTHLYISDRNFPSRRFMSEMVISSSIKHLYFMESYFSIDQLIRLLKCTPCLEKLSIGINQNLIYHDLYMDEDLRSILPAITILKLRFVGYSDGLEYLFQLMSNLHDLKIETINLNIDGYEWEDMICNYLLNLTIFHLKMSFNINVDNNIEREVDELLQSFQTSYWILERQLFFRCHWNPEYLDCDQQCSIFFYSLPYVFDTFYYIDPICSKSTCSNQTDSWSYDSVHTLSFVLDEKKQNPSEFPVRFDNVRHLVIGCKLENIEIFCSRFDQLITLHIQCLDGQIQSRLQTLLQRAPRLQSIIFYKNNWLLFFVASNSVRRLTIRDGIYYNIQQCTQLCTATLFHQCEVLEINIRTPSSVIDLIKKMPNLRTLIFQCERDEWKKNQISSLSLEKNDEVVKWLKHYLSSEYSIQRENSGSIRLWIS